MPTLSTLPEPPTTRASEPVDVTPVIRESERRSLASDLHDGPAQTLAYAAMRLQMARAQVASGPDAARAALEQADAAVRDALCQIRAMMGGLRPLALDGRSLLSALRDECAAVNRRGAISAEFAQMGEEERMEPGREAVLFRAAREALLNAENHSGGRHVGLGIEFGRSAITVTIVDDGRGFEPGAEAMARRSGRMGMAAMRERMTAVGGVMTACNIEDGGARVSLRCPHQIGAMKGLGEPL